MVVFSVLAGLAQVVLVSARLERGYIAFLSQNIRNLTPCTTSLFCAENSVLIQRALLLLEVHGHVNVEL